MRLGDRLQSGHEECASGASVARDPDGVVMLCDDCQEPTRRLGSAGRAAT